MEVGMSTEQWEVHALADFLFPFMTDDEYQALKESIEKSGQLEPIMLFQGKILDGRHRYKVCQELGIAVRFVAYHGTNEGAIRVMMALNAHRRHLTPEQLREANEHKRGFLEDLAQARMYAGQKSGGRGKKKNSRPNWGESFQDGESIESPQKNTTAYAMAKANGIGKGSQHRYDYVMQHGDEETQTKLRDGTLTISAAHSIAYTQHNGDDETKRALAAGEISPNVARERTESYIKNNNVPRKKLAIKVAQEEVKELTPEEKEKLRKDQITILVEAFSGLLAYTGGGHWILSKSEITEAFNVALHSVTWSD